MIEHHKNKGRTEELDGTEIEPQDTTLESTTTPPEPLNHRQLQPVQ